VPAPIGFVGLNASLTPDSGTRSGKIALGPPVRGRSERRRGLCDRIRWAFVP